VLTAEARPADQSIQYGEQFAGVYDRVFPRDDAADDAAAFLRELIRGADPTAVELGVGTARVAAPLARLGVRVHGIDSSPQMLAAAGVAVTGLPVTLERADIRTWEAPRPVDLAYCICATISMLSTEDEQRAVLARLAAAVVPGGHVVVETHSPARILRLHAQQDVVSFTAEVSGLRHGLRTVSVLDADRTTWRLHHSWEDDEGEHDAQEFSRLTTPETLVSLAAEAGLSLVSCSSDWSGGDLDPFSPTYVAVLTAPPSPTDSRGCPTKSSPPDPLRQ
jgi:SAM-dependent methyltransferase